MRTFLSFPTWVLVLVLTRWLPTAHPWHGKQFTLADWTGGGTEINRALGALMWLQVFLLPCMFLILLGHR